MESCETVPLRTCLPKVVYEGKDLAKTKDSQGQHVFTGLHWLESDEGNLHQGVHGFLSNLSLGGMGMRCWILTIYHEFQELSTTCATTYCGKLKNKQENLTSITAKFYFEKCFIKSKKMYDESREIIDL